MFGTAYAGVSSIASHIGPNIGGIALRGRVRFLHSAPKIGVRQVS
jgi:hypothetical protein